MTFDLNALMRRLESAQAIQNDAFTRAAGGQSRPIGGGFAHFRGDAHPLNQALGLLDPIPDQALTDLEHFLGCPTVLELCPAADPHLWIQLAARGYRLQQFQHQLARTLDALPPQPLMTVRLLSPGEEETFARVVSASFMDSDAWRTHTPLFATPQVEGASAWMVCVEGEPAGGGTLGLFDGVALLSGDGVLPRFRGRGVQKALILARLYAAREAGAEWACASTLPSSPSQSAYEACGFRVRYPKVEMAKG